MIILTGYKGFIGQAFEKKLDSENLYRVEQSGAFDFLNQYKFYFSGYLYGGPYLKLKDLLLI